MITGAGLFYLQKVLVTSVFISYIDFIRNEKPKRKRADKMIEELRKYNPPLADLYLFELAVAELARVKELEEKLKETIKIYDAHRIVMRPQKGRPFKAATKDYLYGCLVKILRGDELSHDERSSALAYFLPRGNRVPRTAAEWLWKFVGTDESRLRFTKMYCRSGVMYATDGHRMGWSELKYVGGDGKDTVRLDDGYYNLSKDGSPVLVKWDETFPDVTRVVTPLSEYTDNPRTLKLEDMVVTSPVAVGEDAYNSEKYLDLLGPDARVSIDGSLFNWAYIRDALGGFDSLKISAHPDHITGARGECVYGEFLIMPIRRADPVI